ncbi:N-(5'-phosphoribosyl)anthranilate isomerase [Gimesia panareensis]|uniref:N-(5'-phosphoribosyl)anthranilate isomerase n=1 Tax=Gimesia panareensis TaxID=2527978 RepID=A0A518FR49_9PLAN|nr:phosphoribosylanthranilate isomerase [Gimesia panareensis]QDV18823.1 N-(5'-phosphoribosyl)anthranilate isomerase [Gimesia panareensis]
MWIKICGIRDAETARMVADLGASALGLNFYEPSPRSISIETAREIEAAVTDKDVSLVGLFVNHSLEEIGAICSAVAFDLLQLHGDESPEFLAELGQRFPNLPLIRAFRVRETNLASVAAYLSECDRCGKRPDYLLIDAYSPESFGGTGKVAPWAVIQEHYQFDTWPPLILAGGLTPENVAAAIQAVRPFGVDTASGVETAPGIKNEELVASFVKQSEKA